MMSQLRYEYKRSVTKEPKNPDAFIYPFKAMIYFIQGNRGSGKSSTDEVIAEENYNAGHTIVDLHSADNYESLYWAIEHGCGRFWEKWRKENDSREKQLQEEEPLHCNCNKRYPIVLVVPDYVEIDQDAVDRFNGKYYSKEEWRELGNVEGYYQTKKGYDGKTYKEPPIKPEYREWLKVKHLRVPNKGFKNRDIFVEELTDIMLLARHERRIVVFNPAFFEKPDHKLVMMEKVLRELGEISRSHFKPNTGLSVARERARKDPSVDPRKPIPYEEWTQQEKNSHRITILIREFGSLVASQLNEEKNQVIVKKAVFRLVKIIRQYRMSLVADFQRHGDVYAGVRDQRDVFIWRCTNPDMFPDDYEWLQEEINDKYHGTKRQLGDAIAKRLYPKIEDLDNDEMIVLYPKKNRRGRRWKKFKVRMPFFHHHQEDDDFEDESGIIKETPKRKGTWRFVVKKKSGELVDTKKDEIESDKKVQEANMQKLYEMADKLMHPTDPSVKKMTARKTFEHLQELNMIPDTWTSDANLRKFMSRMKKKVTKNVATTS